MQQQLVQIEGNNYNFLVNNETIHFDAKEICQAVFEWPTNALADLKKNVPFDQQGSRSHCWVKYSDLQNFLVAKRKGENFLFDLKEKVFELLFAQGNRQFKSERQIADEQVAKQVAEMAELNNLKTELAETQKQLAKELDAKNVAFRQLSEIADSQIQSAKAAFGFQLIKFFHSPSFPVLFAIGMMIVLGAFSVHICVNTMGMDWRIATGYAVIFEIFPLLCAIWAHTFKLKVGQKVFEVDPLTVTMMIHTIFVSYHVGWLNPENFSSDYAFGLIGKSETNFIVAASYVLMPPFIQKTLMGLILRIANQYKMKGWLKLTE